MTPGILAAQRARVAFTVHEYEHDPAAESYGNEAVEKTGANPDQVFKTLVVSLDGKDLAVAVVPVSAMLSLKLIARAAGAKKAAMADPPWPTNSWFSALPAMFWVASARWGRRSA